MDNFAIHYDVGEDGGNGYQKTSINDEIFLYPSLISKRFIDSGISNSAILIDANNSDAVDEFFGQNEFLKQMDATVASDGLMQNAEKQGRFLVGNSATATLGEVESYNVTRNTSKHESDISFICLLTLISYCSIRDFWNEKHVFPEEINVKVDRFATALPLNEFKRNGVSANFLKRFTDKKHNVTINNFNKLVKVNIEFNYVNVMPEGLPATLALVNDLDNPLEYRHDNIFDEIYYSEDRWNDPDFKTIESGKDLEGLNILGIDIGDGSTDFTISKGINNQLPLSRGLEEGIGTTAQRAINILRESNPNNVRGSRQKFLNFAMTGKGRVAQIYREKLDEQLDLFFKNLDNAAAEIISGYQDGIDIVIVSGGGAAIISNYHLEKFRNLMQNASGLLGVPILVVPAQFSQFLNLTGLRILLKRAKLLTTQNAST